jgi:hypothetical protein
MKATTLSDSEYLTLLNYLQALRKWPQAKKFPPNALDRKSLPG